MNRRTRIQVTVLAVSLVLAGVGYSSMPVSVRAGDGLTLAAAFTTLPALTGDDSEYTYVGNKTCKKCHIKQYKSWEKTRMAQSFDILLPGHSEAPKKKHSVDVNMDFAKDMGCLECHVVGLGKDGGYHIPDPADKKAVRKAKKLRGVGCECCHGPGSGYVPVFEEIQKSKRKYNVEELYAVGLEKIGEATCAACHTDRSPTVDPDNVFDDEKRPDQGTHEHFPLKRRE